MRNYETMLESNSYLSRTNTAKGCFWSAMMVLSLQVLECEAVSADKVPTETTLDALATAPTALVLKWKHPASCGDKCSSHFEQYRITATWLDKVNKNGDQFLIERVFFLLLATDVSSLVVDASTGFRDIDSISEARYCLLQRVYRVKHA
jgi:hypothetical protein